MSKRLAILGGGPIGIEAAVLASQRGYEVTIFERGAVGAHVGRWGHVQFFSPWRLNRSAWGESMFREAGLELGDADGFPTGREYLRTYLHPLAEATGVLERVRTMTTVHGVARPECFKGDLIGRRAEAGPFLVWAIGPQGDASIEADIVFDATGVYGRPGSIGRGGLPAPGEHTVADLCEHWIPDPLDRDRDGYAGRHVLLVGSGYSAATTLRLLMKLREDAPQTRVTWAIAPRDPLYVEIEDDSLPQRLALAQFGNRAARGDIEGLEVVRAPIASLQRDGDLAVATFLDGSTAKVDRIVANVGYRPDLEMTRELQFHQCYASEGPMKLAATLLAQDGNADCLAQESAGVDTLRNPEADFWVVGGKSYGRNSNFLLRVGFEQVETILDDYAAR